eukprot:CAMPEP_0177340678 /NCGR_PEP_ID=MMETSP0368-20130122/26085_1 /TAXON_ID=447022 ORGANISM="Scrippsiella hangoei-like, Strain SHHI-4" /NCGR_SAMPLE_ID=MMETSP0368 /ASSEMBLY_ACC=CAM_ASM_000363 /LENGTH=367 /DNA_ID=CAMNT_0018801889 /DNA_START=42 /DNA_END=1143 /DNA_ORIENTATION=+
MTAQISAFQQQQHQQLQQQQQSQLHPGLRGAGMNCIQQSQAQAQAQAQVQAQAQAQPSSVCQLTSTCGMGTMAPASAPMLDWGSMNWMTGDMMAATASGLTAEVQMPFMANMQMPMTTMPSQPQMQFLPQAQQHLMPMDTTAQFGFPAQMSMQASQTLPFFGTYIGEAKDGASMFFPNAMTAGSTMQNTSCSACWADEPVTLEEQCMLYALAAEAPMPPQGVVLNISAENFPEPNLGSAATLQASPAPTSAQPTAQSSGPTNAVAEQLADPAGSQKQLRMTETGSSRQRGGRGRGGAAAAAAGSASAAAEAASGSGGGSAAQPAALDEAPGATVAPATALEEPTGTRRSGANCAPTATAAVALAAAA